MWYSDYPGGHDYHSAVEAGVAILIKQKREAEKQAAKKSATTREP